MPSSVENTMNLKMQLQAIELLKGSINEPPATGLPISNYSFNVNVEQRPDAERRLVFVIVTIDITPGTDSNKLGSLTASCIFFIENFEEVISANEHGQLQVAGPASTTLTSISLSTVRGLMFAIFKGTYLHNAVLPIIDPTTFNFVHPLQQSQAAK